MAFFFVYMDTICRRRSEIVAFLEKVHRIAKKSPFQAFSNFSATIATRVVESKEYREIPSPKNVGSVALWRFYDK